MADLTLKAKDLKLGDTVQLSDGPWMTAIVAWVDDELVKFFRPYGTTADFSCGNQVICYTGVEHFAVFRSSNADYKVMSRKELE